MNQRLLAVAVLLYALGMGLFLNGFLLTKREIQRRSSAYDFHSLRGPAASLQQPSAVFLFVVDALRLDFMQEMNVSAADSQSAISYNRFTTVHQLLRENASHAALFGFRADPPTVTAQRLQALTAGGIPTFLDIRSNMDAARMAEDNWVAQLRAQGQRHLVFLGDDTWEALLPGLFDVSRPFYSFNTRDLYSADDGIERNLFKEMDRAPWDLMVAHFLGVDHVGHTHSAFHPIMRERLDRMDALVHEVIER